MAEKIKVLVIDDSALVREFLRETFESDPDLTVVGVARDPFFARDKVVKLKPEVITLDIEMPRMDGLTFLTKLMAAFPTPVVMFSSHTEAGAKATIEALRRGAVDFVSKPKTNLAASLPALRQELIDKVKTAARVKVGLLRPAPDQIAPVEPEGHLGLVAPALLKPRPSARADRKVVVLGASTGGTVAIEDVLATLPAETAPLAIVQHMPPSFTKAFADRLNGLVRLKVEEAKNGQRLEAGQVLIAPGGRHMLLQSDAKGYYVEVKDGPPVNRHKPSVDVLFRSAVHSAGPAALGVILTGMGDDGARGLLELRRAGARTLAQNEATCVVYGMPKSAVEIEAVDEVLPLNRISPAIAAFGSDQP